jgi:hypothetical protein
VFLVVADGVGVFVVLVAVGFLVLALGVGVCEVEFGTRNTGELVDAAGAVAMATAANVVRLTVEERPACVVTTREAVCAAGGISIVGSVVVALGSCATLEGATGDEVVRTVAVIVMVTCA